MIPRIFRPPAFAEEEKNFRARFIHGFAWSGIGLLSLAMISHLMEGPQDMTIPILSGLILVMLVALYLLHGGRVNASGLMIIAMGWLGVSLQAFTAEGVKDVIVVAFIALGLLASIVVNWRVGGLVILSSIAVIWLLALAQVNQYLVPKPQEPLAFARDLSFVFVSITVLVYYGTKSMRNAMDRAASSEKDLIRSNQNLKDLNQRLEDRVENRTAELRAANARNERRAGQFEAIAQVARAITSIQEEDLLLSRLAELVSIHFGFYHAGIFLTDEDSHYAVLRASNSEGGRKMLARRHRLKIGQAGLVGYVAATGTPRIALDVESDTVFKDNPDLPETRSELALPLRVGGEIIGVLDVQSREANAFQQEDIEVLYTLADQVAIALQNARSYGATYKMLTEAQRTSVSYLQEAWRLLQSRERQVGYLATDGGLRLLEKPVSTPHVQRTVSQGEAVVEGGDSATLAVPIYVRDEVVGILDVHIPTGHEWDPDEVDIVKAVADRLSLALESATLLKSTQRRAEIERVTAEISGKISASINLRNVLETAVAELGHALPGSEVVIQFEPATNGTRHRR